MSNNGFFGFRKVSLDERKSLIRDVFSSVASKYDIMNDVMSVGIHRLWKEELLKHIPDFNGKLLDMASGTGDIALRYYNKAIISGVKTPDITACDASAEMLDEGKKKAIDSGVINIKYQVCEAESLPFDDNFFDYYIVAFGIRNFTDIEQGLKEAFRVLKKGGKFLCLEFSHINNPILEKIYDIYSMNLIPIMGKVIAKDYNSYKYLAESIKQFPNQEKFSKLIEKAGFQSVEYNNLTFGTVAIHTAYKKC